MNLTEKQCKDWETLALICQPRGFCHLPMALDERCRELRLDVQGKRRIAFLIFIVLGLFCFFRAGQRYMASQEVLPQLLLIATALTLIGASPWLLVRRISRDNKQQLLIFRRGWRPGNGRQFQLPLAGVKARQVPYQVAGKTINGIICIELVHPQAKLPLLIYKSTDMDVVPAWQDVALFLRSDTADSDSQAG